MFKNLFLTVFISLAALTPMSSYCSSGLDDASLANQCLITAQTLYELKKFQTKVSCQYKLNVAGRYVEISGDKIMHLQYQEAKSYLLDAISFLERTETVHCEKLAEISAAKEVLEQINSQIKGLTIA